MADATLIKITDDFYRNEAETITVRRIPFNGKRGPWLVTVSDWNGRWSRERFWTLAECLEYVNQLG